MIIVVRVTIYLLAAFISYFFFRFIYKRLIKLEHAEEYLESSIEKRLKETKKLKPQQQFLSAQGIMYRLKDYQLKPAKYILLKAMLSVLLVMITYLFCGWNAIIFILAGCVGFFGTDFLFKRKNKQDNDEMLNDIFNIYLTLKIQLSSNIYIIDALYASYMIVQHPRMKEALNELIINLSDKTNGYIPSVETFKSRFDSEEIDTLCDFLKSYSSYGVSERYMEDIMAEINEISEESALKQEHTIESKSGLISFLYFTCILAIVLYGAVMSLFQDISIL